MLVFSILLLAAALFYAAFMLDLAVGFRRVRDVVLPAPARRPFVSVVVAAQNEAAGIEACLRAILANDYPPACFEIIVVDDFSEDETAEIVRRLQISAADGPALHLLRMCDYAEAPTGNKRDALARGLAHATGAIIVTTDADCRVGPRWLGTMVRSFEPEVQFVAGPVCYRPGETLFGRMQALEFLALVATGAGGIGRGRPNMCNSANVAYRRAMIDVIEQAGGRHPAADEMLAQHLAAENPASVRFCANPAALVETDPVLEWEAFWAQRRRWAGTGPRYPRRGLVAIIGGVYLFYLMLLLGAAALAFAPALAPAVVAAMALKISAEACLLVPAARHFGQARLLRYFLPEQLLQIPYVVAIGLAAARGEPRWQERRAAP